METEHRATINQSRVTDARPRIQNEEININLLVSIWRKVIVEF